MQTIKRNRIAVRALFALLVAAVYVYIAFCMPEVEQPQLLIHNDREFVVTGTNAVREHIPQPQGVPSAHASSLTRLKDGRLAVAWFGGSYEGAKDTCIYFALRDKDGWSTPKALASRISTALSTDIHGYRIGNPALACDAAGVLHLYYVSTDWFGWAAGKINYIKSEDEGGTWSEPVRLAVNPFLNISSLVRIQPACLADGEVLLPAYFECGLKHPQLIRVKGGRVMNTWNYPQLNGAIQPALADSPTGKLMMYCRDSNDTYKKVRYAEIAQTGELLREGAVNVANSDSSAAVANNGAVTVLVCNPLADGGRNVLSLFASVDGLKFVKITDIEKGTGEYSYPSILAAKGKICISYTFERKCIGYAEYTDEYIMDRLAAGKLSE